MNTIFRKSMLSIAGLAFAGGVFAGPIAAHANPVDAKPAAAAVQTTAPKPQGDQSHIDLNGEQTANAKAIIAA
ncbi:hypothetical protein AB0J36_28375, partial [Micromonospora sp. NPDC049662]